MKFFEGFGYVSTSGAEEFDRIMDYIRKNHIPTWNSIDREAGTVTIHRRPWGAIEGLPFGY